MAALLALWIAAAAAIPQAAEVVAGIQVHGNVATSDDEVRRLAGVATGSPFEAGTLDAVTARLRATKRFVNVETLKRFASIADPSQILLVIVVDEGSVDIRKTGDPDNPVQVVRNRKPINLMVMPVLGREDGYGFTYGALLARPGILGKNSRLSFPLTWGGEKRAAAEIDKLIPGAPIDRVMGGVGISRRTNPFFEQDEDRTSTWVRGEREIVKALRVGATAGWQRVTMVGNTDEFAHAGADVVVDTRIDPNLPRNAVYFKAGWDHFAIRDGINRFDVDARGYVGVYRQNVLAVRAQKHDGDGPLPPYLMPLLGGMTSLRGFRTGTFAGDTMVATSAELIVPLTSPINIGRIGVSAFVDAGTAYADGQRFRDQTLQRGYGGSLWFSAAFLKLNIAVAHGRGASTRVHVGGNVVF